MNIKLLLLILLSMLSKNNFGCDCYGLESFNLGVYDRSVNIIEVEIVEKLDTEPIAYIDNEDTIVLDLTYVEFQVRIVEVFKGNTKETTSKLHAGDLTSSCHWEPEVGKNYIFYMGENYQEDGIEVFRVYGCQRKTRKDYENYKSDAEALRLLGKKLNGRFRLDQTCLLEGETIKYLPVIGRYKDEKRHGKWILAEPLGFSSAEFQPQKKILVLRYKKGVLISMENHGTYEKRIGNYFLENWVRYYENKIL